MRTEKTKTQKSPVQRGSGIYKLGMGLIWPMGLMGQKPEKQNNPAQRDSGIYKLADGAMGIMRIIGSMGKRHIIKRNPAQTDSKMCLIRKHFLKIVPLKRTPEIPIW